MTAFGVTRCLSSKAGRHILPLADLLQFDPLATIDYGDSTRLRDTRWWRRVTEGTLSQFSMAIGVEFAAGFANVCN